MRKIETFFDSLDLKFLEDITPYHIEQLKAKLKKDGLSKKPKSLSKATINRYLQILRGLFYKAIDWEIYNKPNPLKKVRFYAEKSPVTLFVKKRHRKVDCPNRKGHLCITWIASTEDIL